MYAGTGKPSVVEARAHVERRYCERHGGHMGCSPDPSSPAIDPWNAIMDADAARCGLRLSRQNVVQLAGDDAIQRAALELAIRTEWEE